LIRGYRITRKSLLRYRQIFFYTLVLLIVLKLRVPTVYLSVISSIATTTYVKPRKRLRSLLNSKYKSLQLKTNSPRSLI
jgi:hypothetical protein